MAARMKSLNKEIFHNKQWSTENVLLDTLLDIKKLSLSYELLQTLSDIDHEEDLGEIKKMLIINSEEGGK